MKLTTAIKLYRNHKTIQRAVRRSIGIHHALRPANRGPCTLDDCSGTGLAEAMELGWRALPGILTRINACGFSTDSDCQKTKPCQSLGSPCDSPEAFCGATGMPHFCDIGSIMPAPNAPGFRCDDTGIGDGLPHYRSRC